MSQPLILLGMPCYSRQVDIGAARSLYGTPARIESGLRVSPAWARGGVTHNTLWAQALNARELGATHFAMIHSDVEPEFWWLEKLWKILQERQVDLVSAVIPIKSAEGLTSTGLVDPKDPRRLVRRLTLTEVHALPETFSAEEVEPGQGKCLCFNTGLWLCDLHRPWVERVNLFSDSRVERQRLPGSERATWVNTFESDDWLFSQQLHALGGTALATRAVKVVHWGEQAYSNECWGAWDHDLAYAQIRDQESGVRGQESKGNP